MTPTLTADPLFRTALARIWQRHRKPWPQIMGPDALRDKPKQEPVTLTSLHGFMAQNPDPTVPPNWSGPENISMTTCRRCHTTVPTRETEYHDAWEKLCGQCYVAVQSTER